MLAHLRSFGLPLTAAGVVPALIAERLDPRGAPLWRWVVAALLLIAGLSMLAWTISLFARIGKGTLAPWNPTHKLVVAGPYTRVRNPMISGVTAVICGEATLLGSPRVALWAAAFVGINHVYFLWSEEPGLVKRFGEEYAEYCRHVPRWIPSLRPWRPD